MSSSACLPKMSSWPGGTGKKAFSWPPFMTSGHVLYVAQCLALGGPENPKRPRCLLHPEYVCEKFQRPHHKLHVGEWSGTYEVLLPGDAGHGEQGGSRNLKH